MNFSIRNSVFLFLFVRIFFNYSTVNFKQMEHYLFIILTIVNYVSECLLVHLKNFL